MSPKGKHKAHDGFRERGGNYPMPNPGGRNVRSVWTIATQAYREAHFATYPEELALKCVKAGTSEKGYCPKCGMPWLRIISREEPPVEVFTNSSTPPEDNLIRSGSRDFGEVKGSGQKLQDWRDEHLVKTLGWKPTCSCGLEPVPGIVLDPFSGSATSGAVAEFLGRKYVGLELKPDYISISKKRIAGGIKNKRILSDFPKQENPQIQEIEPLLPFPEKVETKRNNERTIVVHCKKHNYDVLIDRTTKWGNKYKIGIDGDRTECVMKFKRDFYSNPELQEQALKELSGKILGCWCKERPDDGILCHGDIYAAYCNSIMEEGK